MRKIFEKLKESDVYTGEVGVRLREFWKYCIEEIQDPTIRSAVTLYLENVAPWQFFLAPASPTGKHHPQWQNEPGGILRNTMECCVSVQQIMRQEYTLSDNKGHALEPDRSIIYAATIISDTCKCGNPWGSKSLPDHGAIAADLWKPIAAQFFMPQNMQDLIYEGIYWHLGRWTPGWTPEINAKLSSHTKIVQVLDALYADTNLEKIFRPISPLYPMDV